MTTESRWIRRVLGCLAIMVISVPCSAADDLYRLQADVGDGAKNARIDVLRVQLLLNQLMTDDDDRPLLDPDGIYGPATQAAMDRSIQTGDRGTSTAVTFAEQASDAADNAWPRLKQRLQKVSVERRAVQIARGEAKYWRNGQRTELQPRVSWRLQLYWRAAGQEFTPEQLQTATFQNKWPWSAAFVSWVMKMAGAESRFKYTASHWQYVAAGKAARQQKDHLKWWAVRPGETPVQVGVIVVKKRGSGTANYENIELGHPTHGDLVVSLQTQKAISIGGNVGNSVRQTPVDLDSNARPTDERYFAIVCTAQRAANDATTDEVTTDEVTTDEVTTDEVTTDASQPR